MGRELQCRAKSGGKWYEGKALLETSEILFRGDLRLKIPFPALTAVATQKGKLLLEWAGQSAVLELGAQADKWAHAILHPKTTSDKLGLKPTFTISALDMPTDATMSDAAKMVAAFSDSKLLPGSDIIFYGAVKVSDLKRIPKLLRFLAANGALWIVYPKGKKEITEVQVIAAGRAVGLYDIKVVSYSATHTALKFVRPKNKR